MVRLTPTYKDPLKGCSYAKISKEAEGLGKLHPKTEKTRWMQAIDAGISGNLPLIILGNSKIREDRELLYNFGYLAASAEDAVVDKKVLGLFFEKISPVKKTKKESTKQIDEHIQKGAVINTANWYPFLNDCFIYGGISANKEFHLGTNDIPDELIWDAEEKRPTAVGRELLMLKFSGYECSYNKKFGVIFSPPAENPGENAENLEMNGQTAKLTKKTVSTKKAAIPEEVEEATLVDYRKAIEKIKSIKEIRDFLENKQEK